MNEQFCTALEFTIRWEGGWSPNTKNAGLSAMRGITQKAYDRHRYLKNKNRQVVKLISDEEVSEIYYNTYWVSGKCVDLAWPLNMVHFDTLVKDGPKVANKILEECDFSEINVFKTARKYLDMRVRHYEEVIKLDSFHNMVTSRSTLVRCNDLRTTITELEKENDKDIKFNPGN